MRSDLKWRRLLNDLQYDMVAKVAHHVCEELQAAATNSFSNLEPFSLESAWWTGSRQVSRAFSYQRGIVCEKCYAGTLV